jgi:hypothetical protein
MLSLLRALPAVVALAFYGPHPARAEEALDASLLDRAAFSQWVAGTETAVTEKAAPGGPQSVVLTTGGKLAFYGVKFGEGREAGLRHLRVGFTEALPVGSVLVRGGGALSVLKASAVYPGNPADDSQWLPAERLAGDAVSRAEVGVEGYALWTLPPGTRTRALRFSHQPIPGDREMAGWLGGIQVLTERAANLAPQALVKTVAREDVSAKLVDESNNRMWDVWHNGENGTVLPICPENPAIITLTWREPVRLSGLCLLWAGFRDVEVDVLEGQPDDPMDETNGKWRLVAASREMDARYPIPLVPGWLDFEKPALTRAVRLRITSVLQSGHSHLADKMKDGRRVWLGEVLAVSELKNAALATQILPKPLAEPPPIPIKFTLPEAGLVTLVIEDLQNKRVRNLVSETPFPAGENTAWWDGSDDLLRDPEAAAHGVYHIPARPVAPGNYQVRGLWHRPLELRYEFSIYNSGKPPWETADKTGCWMTNHTPPTSVAFVPGSRTVDGLPLLFMGAQVSEGGHGLQWLREDGTKIGGQGWVGGNWTGAATLAVDSGQAAIADHLCYVGSIWDGELRLTAKNQKFEDQPVLKFKLGDDPDLRNSAAGAKPVEMAGFDGGTKTFVLGGIAARDGLLVGSLVRQNELIMVDLKTGTIVGRAPVENPRGVAFDARGRLLVLSGVRLLRYSSAALPALRDVETVVASGLGDPRHVLIDAAGNFLITDRGGSHQVKMFSPSGKPLRAIGKPGAPATGPYDRLHLNNPNGLAIDSHGRLWVAEADNQPRRISVWSPKGELVRAFYGPTEYGGGGVLDPQDATRFFYKGLEFRLDWKGGTDELRRVFYRPDRLLEGHYGPYSPDTPLYPEERKGTRYFTSCFTHTPTGGDHVAFIWRDGEKDARLVAALGSAHSWPILRNPEFRPLWPEGTSPDEENPSSEQQATFAWSDENDDARPEPGEVHFLKMPSRGITVMNDLTCVIARHGIYTAGFSPTRFTSAGVPVYDLAKSDILGPAGGDPPSSGGDQALTVPGDWTITTNAPAPFQPHGLGGMIGGEPRWSYPSAWPGLHASHEAAVPDRPGMVIGHTRLLGGWVRPPGEGGPLFCVNGNMGNMYLFTADGLFVATLFHDIRMRPTWASPLATRNMDLTGISLHDENFWPGITQTPEGKVFLVDGARTSLVRVDGLDSIKRLPLQPLTVTADDLDNSRDWLARTEAARQKSRGSGVLTVPLQGPPPQVDGRLDDWPSTTDWAIIDRRGTAANFNSNSKPYEVSAAVRVSEGHLFAAWRTTEKALLENSCETPNALFKTGGCLDLMLGSDPAAAIDRSAPVAGDLRLLVTLVKGRTSALLYRAKVPGTGRPIPFSSPSRTVLLDSVEDVTAEVRFAADGQGNYEIGIPLLTLGWQPKVRDIFRADLGVLRGTNSRTTQRVYWSNKATAITADVPSEAELTPRLWGKWRITEK